MDMREQKFGIEIELTGITRQKAAEVIGKYLGQPSHYDGGYYEVLSNLGSLIPQPMQGR